MSGKTIKYWHETQYAVKCLFWINIELSVVSNSLHQKHCKCYTNVMNACIILVRVSRRLKFTLSVVRPSLTFYIQFLWNGWTEFDETWHEASTQRPLSTMCFFGPIGKKRWPHWHLICQSVSTSPLQSLSLRNLMKLCRKRVLSVLYQVCLFLVDRKTKLAVLAPDWLSETFPTFLQLSNGIWLHRKQILNVLFQVCVWN